MTTPSPSPICLEDVLRGLSRAEIIALKDKLDKESRLRRLTAEQRAEYPYRRSGPCLVCETEFAFTKKNGQLNSLGNQWLDNLYSVWKRPPEIAPDTTRGRFSIDRIRINGKHLTTWSGLVCECCIASIRREWVPKFDGIVPAQESAQWEPDPQEEAERRQYLDDLREAAQDPEYRLTDRFHAIREFWTEQDASEVREMPYSRFLRSWYWDVVRRYCLYRAQWECALCSRGGKLHVHHKTYERHGWEHECFDTDLIVLCRNCHAKFHDKLAKEPEAEYDDAP